MRRWGLVAAMLVALGAGFGWWLVHGAAEPTSQLLTITSVPAGARLTIAGVVVGHTPYFGDNRYPPGPVEYLLDAPSFRAVRGTFDGGTAFQLEVRLVRKVVRRTLRVDAGELELDLDTLVDDDEPLHEHGPLRPPEPTDFVDDDLAKEAVKR